MNNLFCLATAAAAAATTLAIVLACGLSGSSVLLCGGGLLTWRTAQFMAARVAVSSSAPTSFGKTTSLSESGAATRRQFCVTSWARLVQLASKLATQPRPRCQSQHSCKAKLNFQVATALGRLLCPSYVGARVLVFVCVCARVSL